MAKSTVYFTNELTPEAVVKMYRQLGIELLLAFHAVDFLAQVHHIRFHLVVPGRVFCRYHAVLITGRIQEGVRRIPEVLALLAQC